MSESKNIPVEVEKDWPDFVIRGASATEEEFEQYVREVTRSTIRWICWSAFGGGAIIGFFSYGNIFSLLTSILMVVVGYYFDEIIDFIKQVFRKYVTRKK